MFHKDFVKDDIDRLTGLREKEIDAFCTVPFVTTSIRKHKTEFYLN